MTAEKLELSTKLNAVDVEFEKRLEEQVDVRGVRNCAEGFVRSIVNQSVRALHAFVNPMCVQLVNCSRLGLEESYASSKSPFSYMLTHVSDIGVPRVEVQIPVSLAWEGEDSAGTYPSAPVPQKPSTPPAKGSYSRSKKGLG